MNAYVYQAALLCEHCARQVMKEPIPEHVREAIAEGLDYDSDDWPCGPYEHGGGEADSPQHCDRCHVFLENPLTADGVAYVVEYLDQIGKTHRGQYQLWQEWKAFYSDVLPA